MADPATDNGEEARELLNFGEPIRFLGSFSPSSRVISWGDLVMATRFSVKWRYGLGIRWWRIAFLKVERIDRVPRQILRTIACLRIRSLIVRRVVRSDLGTGEVRVPESARHSLHREHSAPFTLDKVKSHALLIMVEIFSVFLIRLL